MAIGKISGVMLQSNLERQGVNLSFDGNLVYFDVNNRRLGIKTTSPQYELDVTGTVRAIDYIGVSITASGNVNVGNLIATGGLTASNATLASVTSSGPISGTTGTFGNIYTTLLSSSGTATVNSLDVNSAATVGGNLSVTGNTSLSDSVYISGVVTGNNSATFNGGIESTTIGAASPESGTFTNLTATSSTFITTLDASGTVVITDTTISLDYTTGALIVAGGTGIGGNLNVGEDVAAAGNLDITGNGYIDGTLTAGELITNADATITGNITATIGSFTDSINIATNTIITSTQIAMDATTPSTDYSTGAVVVSGGVGIGGNLNVLGSVSTSNLIVNGGDLTNVNIGNITFSNTTISTKLVDGNVTIAPTGTGVVEVTSDLNVTGSGDFASVSAGNVSVTNQITTNTVTATTTTVSNIVITDTSIEAIAGNLTLVPENSGILYITSNAAIQLPSGTIEEQPANPPIGALRYNTIQESPEFWNGTAWITTTATIDSELITPTGATNTYTLGRSTVTAGVMVSLNGVLQIPYRAYTVSDNQITFAETPLITDIVDIRYISTGAVNAIHEEQSFFIKSANFNVEVNTRYAVDTTSGAVTATLPATPALGDAIFFADAGGNYSANNLTVARNGGTIQNSSSNLVINTDGESFGLVWTGSTWRRY